MVRLSGLILLLAACGDNSPPAPDPHCADWHQMGGNAQHTGASCATGQPIERILADVVIDQLFDDELAASHYLPVHFQAPLIDGDRVFMVRKGGVYTPCEPLNPGETSYCAHLADFHRFESQTWSEVGYAWQGDQLVEQWTFDSDWKPPLGNEVVFHPVIAGDRLVAPMAGGAVAYVDPETGETMKIVRPFDDPDVYIVGALAEWHGVVLYNAMKIDPEQLYTNAQSWLVEIDVDGRVRKADYADLVDDAPSECVGEYGLNTPPADAPYPVLDGSGAVVLPDEHPCGPQVPGFNAAPAISPDGLAYVVTSALNNSRYSYLVAVNPGHFDVQWARSLRGYLADGCGVSVPYATQPSDFLKCRAGAPMGIDPFTGMAPAGLVYNRSSSSPVVMPDGRILYGSYSSYNDNRGHLFQFSRDGKVLGTYDFGWDLTPGVGTVDGETRIVMKDNHYGDYTPGSERGPFYLTLLSGDLEQVWQYQSTETNTCARQPDGSVQCTDDQPYGFEWCISAPAIDATGTIYGNSEDGNVYALGPDGSMKGRVFLDRALGASYTPVTLDHAGRVYALNAGHMYVVGAN